MMNRTTQRPTGAELVEKIVTKGNRARIRDRQARTVADACWCCGDRPNTDHRYPRRPAGKPADLLGMEGKRQLYVIPCRACAEAEWQVRGRHEVTGMTGRRSVEADVVAERLEEVRPGFIPDGIEIGRRHLPALTWVGIALDFPGVDPPHGKPFDHLPASWATLDFGPAPAPPRRRSRPTSHARRIVGCLLCGVADVTGEPVRYSREWFGFAPRRGAGIAGNNLSGRLCLPCKSKLDTGRYVGYSDGSAGGSVSFAVTHRLNAERPDVLAGTGAGRGDEALDPSALREYSLSLIHI